MMQNCNNFSNKVNYLLGEWNFTFYSVYWFSWTQLPRFRNNACKLTYSLELDINVTHHQLKCFRVKSVILFGIFIIQSTHIQIIVTTKQIQITMCVITMLCDCFYDGPNLRYWPFCCNRCDEIHCLSSTDNPINYSLPFLIGTCTNSSFIALDSDENID